MTELINWLRHLKCRYDYWRLSDSDKRLFKRMGIDPDSLKKDGAFDD